MAVVYTQTDMSVTHAETDNPGGHTVAVSLNKGGSTGVPRDNVTVALVLSAGVNPFADVTKTYDVTIQEH